MRFVQMQSTTFLVRETGCDAETLRIPAGCLFSCGHSADHIPGLLIAFGPTPEEQHGTIRLPGHRGFGACDESARLDTPAHGIEATGRALPSDRHLAPRAADIGPPCLIERMVQADAVACAIAQDHHPRPQRAHLLSLLDQSNMALCGEVPLLACTHHPGQ